MKPKYESVKVFLNALNDDNITPKQKKHILLHCTKIQRLTLAEIILNVILGNVAVGLSDEICDSLQKYKPHLTNIISLGKKITNQVLSLRHRAVVFAIQISLDPLNGEIVKSDAGLQQDLPTPPADGVESDAVRETV